MRWKHSWGVWAGGSAAERGQEGLGHSAGHSVTAQEPNVPPAVPGDTPGTSSAPGAAQSPPEQQHPPQPRGDGDAEMWLLCPSAHASPLRVRQSPGAQPGSPQRPP